MIWKRQLKVKKIGRYIDIEKPKPAKKEFEIMLNLLKDAEELDSNNQVELSLEVLKMLRKTIKKYENLQIHQQTK